MLAALPLAPVLAAALVAGLAALAWILAPWRDLVPVVVGAAGVGWLWGGPPSMVGVALWASALLCGLGAGARGPSRGARWLGVGVAWALGLHLLAWGLDLAGVGPDHWRPMLSAVGGLGCVLLLAGTTWRPQLAVRVRWVGHIPVQEGSQSPTTSS